MDTDSSYNSINYEQLAQHVEQVKQASPELQQAEHKKVVFHVVQHHFTPEPTQGQLPHKQSQEESSLPEYAHEASVQAQDTVKDLIALTIQKGIPAGIKAAQQQEPFIMDMYHDALVDKLVEGLQERNLL